LDRWRISKLTRAILVSLPLYHPTEGHKRAWAAKDVRPAVGHGQEGGAGPVACRPGAHSAPPRPRRGAPLRPLDPPLVAHRHRRLPYDINSRLFGLISCWKCTNTSSEQQKSVGLSYLIFILKSRIHHMYDS
jgi:hypothetical protein